MITYYQPSTDTKIEKVVSDFSVWLDKDTCQKEFPGADILTFTNGDIIIPRFMDTKTTQVNNKWLAEILTYKTPNFYDIRDYEDEEDFDNRDIHVFSIYTPQLFIDNANETKDMIIADGDEDALEIFNELVEYFIKNRDVPYTCLEFID